MISSQEQWSTAARANLTAGFSLYNSLASATLNSLEKLINLNVTAAKASMEESTAATRQMLTAKDPRELLTLISAQTRPSLEKVLSYSSHVANIASGAQAEFTKAAEAQIVEASRKFNQLMEESTKNAPHGSDNLKNMMRTAFASATSNYEQFANVTRQAVDAIESNLTAATRLAPAVPTAPTAPAAPATAATAATTGTTRS